jgi:hypothetical protein
VDGTGFFRKLSDVGILKLLLLVCEEIFAVAVGGGGGAVAADMMDESQLRASNMLSSL